jgi:hypothetical protein
MSNRVSLSPPCIGEPELFAADDLAVGAHTPILALRSVAADPCAAVFTIATTGEE